MREHFAAPLDESMYRTQPTVTYIQQSADCNYLC